jgi:hypothetical protein
MIHMGIFGRLILEGCFVIGMMAFTTLGGEGWGGEGNEYSIKKRQQWEDNCLKATIREQSWPGGDWCQRNYQMSHLRPF